MRRSSRSLLASAGLALVLGGTVAFAFLVGIGLPAWWIGYLALLARPAPGPDADDDRMVSGRPHRRVDGDRRGVRRCRVSMLRYGLDAAQMHAGLRRELERALRFLAGAPRRRAAALAGRQGPRAPARHPRADRAADEGDRAHADEPAQSLARGADRADLGTAEAAVAGDRADDFSAVRPTVLAIAVAGTFLPDLIGLASGVFTASLLLAYALLGFAVLHAITPGISGRGFMLTGLYLHGRACSAGRSC